MEKLRRSRSKHGISIVLIVLCGVFGTTQTNFQFVTVEKEVILQRIRDVPGKNPERQQKVRALFAEVGCGDLITEQKVKHYDSSNVLCRLPGETEEVILVGAHFDKVAPGTGVIDNWSGASLLSSLYQSLAAKKRRHTFLFVSFCQEESGLIGSEFYASQMTKDEVARTEAMINIDTLGLSPTKVWVRAADKNLVTALATVANAMKLPVSGMDVDQVGTSDSESFARKHIPRITIHSLTQKTLPILHSKEDKIDNLQPNDYYDSYRLLAGYLAYLDETLQPRTPDK